MAAHKPTLFINVNVRTTNFTTIENTTFCLIFPITLLPIFMLYVSLVRCESINVTSAVSIANAAPAPIATPTLAATKLGASLTPSPHIKTSLGLEKNKAKSGLTSSVSIFISETRASFSSGKSSLFIFLSANPIFLPINNAVSFLSPVNIVTLIPIPSNSFST